MEAEEQKPVPQQRNAVEKRPIGMATAFFKLTDTTDPILSSVPDN